MPAMHARRSIDTAIMEAAFWIINSGLPLVNEANFKKNNVSTKRKAPALLTNPSPKRRPTVPCDADIQQRKNFFHIGDGIHEEKPPHKYCSKS
jgi:hypothetical protein